MQCQVKSDGDTGAPLLSESVIASQKGARVSRKRFVGLAAATGLVAAVVALGHVARTSPKSADAGLLVGLASNDCADDTNGTCAMFDCHESRGPTVCKKDKGLFGVSRCLCSPGYCAVDGVCHATTTTTTQTTTIMTTTSKAKAVVPDKLSALPMVLAGDECGTDTGGTCSFYGCSESRGPTKCAKEGFFNYHCLCSPGYCALDGVCLAATTTAP